MKNLKLPFLIFLLGLILFNGCIKDDFIDDRVDPVLRFTSSLDTLEIDTEFTTGLVRAVSAGTTTITVSFETEEGITVSDRMDITVGEETIITIEGKSGTIITTTFYTLEGEFTVQELDGNLIIEIGEDWKASSNLPGLFVYLTNNPATTADALEIGPVRVFNGAHTYEIPGVGINDYQFLLYFCKPFNIKVGDGEITD